MPIRRPVSVHWLMTLPCSPSRHALQGAPERVGDLDVGSLESCGGRSRVEYSNVFDHALRLANVPDYPDAKAFDQRAACLVDVFAQMSNFREAWNSARWIVFVVGTAFERLRVGSHDCDFGIRWRRLCR